MDDENASKSKIKLPKLDVDKFKAKIADFVEDTNKVNEIAYLLSSFVNDVSDVNVEFGAVGFSNKNFFGFVDWEQKNVNLPNDIEEYGIKYYIPILIHNHPYSTSPFASYDDFETFAKCGVEYGVVTNDIGTFIVKNPEYEINKNNYGNIKTDIKKIKFNMLRDFKQKYGHKYDENNFDDRKNINDMVNGNYEYYLNQYQKVVSKYDMDIMFI